VLTVGVAPGTAVSGVTASREVNARAPRTLYTFESGRLAGWFCPMKRDFSSLSPQEALHVAIFVEERNATLYEQFADLFAEFKDSESLEMASTFFDMAEEERTHSTQLQERYFERYGRQGCIVTDEEIHDIIEMPRLDNGQIFAIAKAKISPVPARKALEVALAAELAAQRFYKRLVEITPDPTLRDFYKELAIFEKDHTRHLEHRMRAAAMRGKGADA
jgi:rubrerythrin